MVSGSLLTLFINKRSSSGVAPSLGIQMHSEDVAGNLACLLDVSSTSLSRQASCSPSTIVAGLPRDISFSVSVLSYYPFSALYDIVQVSLVDVSGSLIFSSLPQVFGDLQAYMIGFQAMVTTEDYNSRREEEAAFETQENISTQDPPPTSTPFYNGPRVAGLVIGSVAVVVVLVALVITMVVGGGKKTSPSGKHAAKGTLPSLISSGGGAMSEGTTMVQLSTATMSTGSNSPNSGSNLLGSIPIAGGVISASMSSALKGTYSMSPASDTPLQGEMIGTPVAQFAGGHKSGVHGTSTSPPQAHTGTMRPSKKTERVALAEAMLYSPRVRAPPKISNQALAALPTEPAPKLKPKYLLSSGAAPAKSLPISVRNLRYNDIMVPPQSSRTGTLRGGVLNDSDRPKRNKKKTLSTSSLGDEQMGDMDNFLGEDDGNSGLFTDDDDSWLDDVVEPHPDDPIYKNDDFYVEIDVSKLSLISPPQDLDASAEYLQAHIAQLSSPLAATPVSLSRSSSASSVKRSKPKKKTRQANSKLPPAGPSPSSPSLPSSIEPNQAEPTLIASQSAERISQSQNTDSVLAKSLDGLSSSLLASSSSLDAPNANVGPSLTDSAASIDSSGEPGTLSPSSSSQQLSSSASSTSAARWNFARPPRS